MHWIELLEESYTITGKEIPKIHLGMDINKINDSTWELGSHSCIKDILPRVKTILDTNILKDRLCPNL